MSCRVKFVVALTTLIFLMCIGQTLVVVLQTVIEYALDDQDLRDSFSSLTGLFVQFLLPMRDLLICLSFTWLYYHQGTKEE
jgi:hypothetical protein